MNALTEDQMVRLAGAFMNMPRNDAWVQMGTIVATVMIDWPPHLQQAWIRKLTLQLGFSTPVVSDGLMGSPSLLQN